MSGDVIAMPAEPSSAEVSTPEHPIAEAINRLLHRAQDIQFAAAVFVPVAGRLMKQQFDEAGERLDKGEKLLESDVDAERAHGQKLIQQALERYERLEYSDVPAVIESSLFVNLFSAFDVFTGELLEALYTRKPALFNRLNRTIPFAEILSATSIEELKRDVLNDEIESFRRKSYSEQFDHLESAFGIKLKAFKRWPTFVECAQRRNLLTHCGGVVSEQYRAGCIKEGFPESGLAALGEQLELGPEYFMASCELLMEVGLKLGQTLWRKLLPDELDVADRHMQHTQYSALAAKQWERARTFGEFAVSQKHVSSDFERRVAIINYAIALKSGGDEKSTRELLASVDWTAATSDFRLAEAVLLDRVDDAAAVMRKIGPEGELVDEQAYHTWPLFRTFRSTEQFQQAYETVYGYPFLAKLKDAADAAKADAQEALERQEQRANESEHPNARHEPPQLSAGEVA